MTAQAARGPPLITIGVPTYGRASAVRARLRELESVLSDEVDGLFVDNASDDETWPILTSAADRMPQLRAIRNPTNLGADRNYLRVLHEARGTFCWLLGDDEPVDWSGFPTLLRALRQESAGAVLLLAPGTPWPHDQAVHFPGPREFFGSFPTYYFPHLSSHIVRTASAKRHLDAALREAGALHAYVPVTARCIAESGITVSPVRLLTGRPLDEPRWRLVDGHLGAWRTMRAAFPDFRERIDELEATTRGRRIVEAVVLEILGLRRRSFRAKHLLQILHLYPFSAYRLLAPIPLASIARVWPWGAARALIWHVRRARGPAAMTRLMKITNSDCEANLASAIVRKMTAPSSNPGEENPY